VLSSRNEQHRMRTSVPTTIWFCRFSQVDLNPVRLVADACRDDVACIINQAGRLPQEQADSVSCQGVRGG
jgi:hypothetical protein